MKDIQTAKSEAIKEFAERMKKRIGFCELPNTVIKGHIDNLVAKMTEGRENG
jgi:hypothetical protein